MYCPHCGSTIDKNAEICVKCGVNVLNYINKNTMVSNDTPNKWVNFLSLCCFPILGIILYFVWKDKQPKAAKSALTFGLIGAALVIFINVILFIFGFMLEINNDSYYYY